MALCRKLEAYAEDILAKYQTGFRRRKSIIRQLVEKFYKYNKDLHVLFVDFKKAYNSIDRE